MERYGHKLNIETVGTQLVATCECGKWHRALPLSDKRALLILVGVLGEKHGRHLYRLGRPSLADYVSNDALPVMPDLDALPEA